MLRLYLFMYYLSDVHACDVSAAAAAAAAAAATKACKLCLDVLLRLHILSLTKDWQKLVIILILLLMYWKNLTQIRLIFCPYLFDLCIFDIIQADISTILYLMSAFTAMLSSTPAAVLVLTAPLRNNSIRGDTPPFSEIWMVSQALQGTSRGCPAYVPDPFPL